MDRPKIVVPAHGEELHLAEHALFAAERGIETVVKARNGDLVVLAPGEPAIIDEVPHGQLARDGSILVPLEGESIKARQRLAFAGIVTIALAIDRKGEMAGVPDVVFDRPAREDGSPASVSTKLSMRLLFQTFESLPAAEAPRC